jgi:hypothetical protein
VAHAVVDDVLVDLVGDGGEVVGLAERGEAVELVGGPDLAAGVRGGAHDDAAGARGDGGGEAVEVDVPRGRREGHEHRGESHRDDGVEVVAVVGLEKDHLVAGREEREHGGREGARGPRGHEHLGAGGRRLRRARR